MKAFIKNTLSAALGTLLAFFMLSILSTIFFISLLSMEVSNTSIMPNSVLKIDLNGMLEERYTDSPINSLLGEDYPTVGLEQVINSIYRAKDESNIKAIYLDAGIMSQASPAMTEEIRQALMDFKQSGKPIFSYGDNYTQGNYYICSTADHLILNPSGQITWQGLVSEPIFFKKLLQRIGVKMQVFRVGTYKSAVEPFTNTEMSDANRKQIESYLSSIWNNMLRSVAESRDLSTDTLNQYADDFLSLAPAVDMIQKQLADTLMYKSDVKHFIKDKLRLNRNPHFITPSDLASVPATASENKIAVYYAFGDIVDISSSINTAQIASDKVCRDLEELANDKQIKAVVIRINSGGGSAFASEQIWHSIQMLKKEKPVVVSMGGMAASGGYYMACAADEIVSMPTTLTGSIGIFGMIPDVSNLLKDKIGLNFDVVKTNEYADFGSMSRPFNANETALMQRYIESGYQLFLKRVADGRNKSVEQIATLAEGRVWTGEQALNNGLVDTLGTLQTAIERAATLAKQTQYSTEAFPKPQKWYETLIDTKQSNYVNATVKNIAGPYFSSFNMLHNLKDMNPIQARMPYEPNIN